MAQPRDLPEKKKRKTDALNIRPVPEAAATAFRVGAALQNLRYGPYLAIVMNLVAIAERDAQKTSGLGEAARRQLAEAGFPRLPAR